MSAQEIIAELLKLKPDELRRVKAKVDELDGLAEESPEDPGKFSDEANGLPDDLAANHDFYLYGAHKNEPRRGRWIPADKSTTTLSESERRGFADRLVELASETRNLPPDLAANHDHYLHRLPKR